MNMERQICNPYLPEYEYIPDGEPHVFEGRVYIYGSHDRFDGKKFCLNDYVCYSADVHDLTNWRYEGVIYTKTQDPRMAGGNHELWAPDVVRGKDGRYYLYYCPDDKILSIGVAVCDEPAGKYEFLGVVKDKDGAYVGERPGDTIQFDPGIFTDGDGTIYLYSGNGPRTKAAIGKEPKASVVMTLEDDMVTIKSEPKKLLPLLGESEGTGFEGHEFFEASSIRKIYGKYYLVYSSVNLHELCYAVSDYPDKEFKYGGVIISNCDSFSDICPGLKTENALSDVRRQAGKAPFDADKKNCFGNNHGGIEKIGDEWYIFYHRQTNRTMFSRQGCAEKITILEDGTIPQVEMTSQGLNGRPLRGRGIYSTSMVCNLYGRHAPSVSHPLAMGKKHPYLTQNGSDTNPDAAGEKPHQYITNGKNKMTAVFRYFEMEHITKAGVLVRGSAKGKLVVRTGPDGEPVGEIAIEPSKTWKRFQGAVAMPDGVQELIFTFEGRGKLDFMKFALD